MCGRAKSCILRTGNLVLKPRETGAMSPVLTFQILCKERLLLSLYHVIPRVGKAQQKPQQSLTKRNGRLSPCSRGLQRAVRANPKPNIKARARGIILLGVSTYYGAVVIRKQSSTMKTDTQG